MEKRFEVIRIAFVGSSQTVGNGGYTFSYPDYFGFWLNQWLESKGSPLRVEIINAGREGITTTDVRAILRQEVLPLNPDYVIFFDGANQLGGSDALIHAEVPIKRQSLEEAVAARHLFPQWLTARFRLFSLIDNAYDLYAPRPFNSQVAPIYQFGFPPDVNETSPDVTSPHLPLGLSTYVEDVRGMAQDAQTAGVHFLISTPFWLDGSELPDTKDPHFAFIARYLKSTFWPLDPGEIRRMADFQTRILRKLAEEDKIAILDIAADFPRDPNLFSDAYHVNQAGVPLLAWIALKRFLPYFTADIAAGTEHQEMRTGYQPPRRIALDYFVFHPQCHATDEQVAKARAVPLDRLKPAQDTAVIQTATSFKGRALAPLAWHYIAALDLKAGCLPGGGWVVVDLVAKGDEIGVGIEKKVGNDFWIRQFVKPNSRVQRISLRVDAFDQIGNFVVENGDIRAPASVELSALKVIADDTGAPSSCPE